jgi:hypothetical protein
LSFHDLQIQADYIRQSLSHDKRPIGLFIGAGCPFSVKVDRGGIKVPLIPDIAGMTALVKYSPFSITTKKDIRTNP